MAIGRFRDDPTDLDPVEQRIAAAQYPEGGLVLGSLIALLIGMVTTTVVIIVGPAIGAVIGFGLGRQYRHYKLARARAAEGE